MAVVYQSGLERVFEIPYVDGAGEPVIPASASYSVIDEDGGIVVASTSLSVVGPPVSATVTVSAEDNTVTAGQIRGFRTVILAFEDAISNQYEQRVAYIIESADVLEPGTNCFARYEHFQMLMQDMPQLKMVNAATDSALKAALINAYYNIGQLNVDFGDELPDVHTTMDISAGDLVTLTTATLDKLKRATLVEADSVLGGNPVEDRRRMGLMSHSAGESAHFFRPMKPLDLPVSKETARILAPFVRYVLVCGR